MTAIKRGSAWRNKSYAGDEVIILGVHELSDGTHWVAYESIGWRDNVVLSSLAKDSFLECHEPVRDFFVVGRTYAGNSGDECLIKEIFHLSKPAFKSAARQALVKLTNPHGEECMVILNLDDFEDYEEIK